VGSATPSRRRGDFVGCAAPAAGASASTPAAPTARPAAAPRRSSCRRVSPDASTNTSGTCGTSEAGPEPSVLDDRVEDERMALPFHDRSSFGVGTSMLGSLGHRARGSPWPLTGPRPCFRAEGRHGYLRTGPRPRPPTPPTPEDARPRKKPDPAQRRSQLRQIYNTIRPTKPPATAPHAMPTSPARSTRITTSSYARGSATA
jgi:hypothetical protein